MQDRKLHKATTIAALSIGGVVLFGNAAEGSIVFPNDLTTGGTASEGPGSSPTNEGPANAFDDNDGTKVLVFSNPTLAVPITLDYDFVGTTANIVRSYSLTSANDAPKHDAATFRLLGSNDNFATAPTVIDTRTGVVFTDGPDADTSNRFETLFFTVPGSPPAFQQYRLELQESFDTNNDRPQLGEMQLFATVVPEPSSLIGVVALGSLGLLGARKGDEA